METETLTLQSTKVWGLDAQSLLAGRGSDGKLGPSHLHGC